MTLALSLDKITKNIDAARQNSPRALKPVTLLAASKGQPEAVLETAIALNIMTFGENKVQEAARKWPALRVRHPGVKLHLIGPLQTNKADDAVALFDMIETLDRPKLAEALSEAMKKAGKNIPCLIQVNTGKEPQKAGVMPEDLAELISYSRSLGLNVSGLMCIPPADDVPAPHFAMLATLAKQHGLSELSMGMSEDYETAIRMGATIVRLGRALLGERS